MARPEHQPDAKTRATVDAMTAYGATAEDIALLIGITAKTLRKHYRTELDTGKIKANAKVAESLFKQATKAEPSVPAAIFWLKAQAGWRETTNVQHSGKIEGSASEEERAARVVGILDAARERRSRDNSSNS